MVLEIIPVISNCVLSGETIADGSMYIESVVYSTLQLSVSRLPFEKHSQANRQSFERKVGVK